MTDDLTQTPTSECADAELPITAEQWEDLSDRIIAVRDRHPRIPNDADTDAIIKEALLPFLRERKSQWQVDALREAELRVEAAGPAEHGGSMLPHESASDCRKCAGTQALRAIRAYAAEVSAPLEQR